MIESWILSHNFHIKTEITKFSFKKNMFVVTLLQQVL